MSARWFNLLPIYTKQTGIPVLLLLVVFILQLCSTIVSSASISTANLVNHAKREREKPGQSGELPLPSQHLFQNMCSERLVRFQRRKKIDAAGTARDKNSELLITSVSFNGEVRIQNAKSKQYLCFNNQGKLKIKHSGDEKCIFEEIFDPMEDSYMYRSKKYEQFYLGFNKKGKKLKGELPSRIKKQKCYHFLKSSAERTLDNKAVETNGPHFGPNGDYSKLPFPAGLRHRRHEAHRDSHTRRKQDIT